MISICSAIQSVPSTGRDWSRLDGNVPRICPTAVLDRVVRSSFDLKSTLRARNVNVGISIIN